MCTIRVLAGDSRSPSGASTLAISSRRAAAMSRLPWTSTTKSSAYAEGRIMPTLMSDALVRGGELPPRAARRERLKADIARLFAGRGGGDGSPRISAALREAGWRVSENTVAALMREQGLAVRRRSRRRATTRPRKGRWRAEDLVGRRKVAAQGIN